MTLTGDDRTRALALLDEATWFMRRCMGGEDSEAVLITSKFISKLRLALKDDAAFIAHVRRVISTPERPKSMKTKRI